MESAYALIPTEINGSPCKWTNSTEEIGRPSVRRSLFPPQARNHQGENYILMDDGTGVISPAAAAAAAAARKVPKCVAPSPSSFLSRTQRSFAFAVQRLQYIHSAAAADLKSLIKALPLRSIQI